MTRSKNGKNKRNQTTIYDIDDMDGSGALSELLKVLAPHLASLAVPLLKKPAEEIGEYLQKQIKKMTGGAIDLPGSGCCNTVLRKNKKGGAIDLPGSGRQREIKNETQKGLNMNHNTPGKKIPKVLDYSLCSCHEPGNVTQQLGSGLLPFDDVIVQPKSGGNRAHRRPLPRNLA